MKVLEITKQLNEDNIMGVARGVAPTVIGQAAKNPGVEGMVKHFTNYGPGIASAAYDVFKGNWTGALINAFTTVAPNSNIKGLAQAGDVVNTLSLLKSIASNPYTLGLFLATYSPGLNSGEDAEIAKIHAQQDAQRPTVKEGGMGQFGSANVAPTQQAIDQKVVAPVVDKAQELAGPTSATGTAGITAAKAGIKTGAVKGSADAVKDSVIEVGPEVLEPLIVKYLPWLEAQAVGRSLPIVGTVIGIAMAGRDLWKGEITGAMANAAAAAFPEAAVYAVCLECSQAMYGQAYKYENDEPAQLVIDQVRHPVETQKRMYSLAGKILQEIKKSFTDGCKKISGKQGQINTRNAARSVNTAGNPMPSTPEFARLQQQYTKESLDHIIKLADVKKPT